MSEILVETETFPISVADTQVQGEMSNVGAEPSRQVESTQNELVKDTHDEEYYFDDDLAVFLVEQRLFRIHRHFLTRDSEFFRGLFECPPPPGEETEGRDDKRPIFLHGVTVHEFKCLLRFLYDGMYKPAITILPDWVALLSISTRFVFDKIRDLAILEISKQMLDPVKKITLANKYNIPNWLPPAFVDLCKRPECVTDLEAETLGLRTLVRVARAREIVREKGYVSWTQRSYFPHDKIYSFNDRGILLVVSEVWPECAIQVLAS